VYVVVFVHDLQRQNLMAEVVSSLTKELSHIAFNYGENPVAVLATPDKVILALTGTNRICVTAVLLHS
jgi:hypothetical protein